MSTEKTKPAVQLVLGSQSPTFPLRVEIPLLDGSKAAVTFTCKAMRKTQLAAARDKAHQAALKAATERNDERPNEVTDLLRYMEENGTAAAVKNGMVSDAEFILLFATGWDVADPLTSEKLQELEDECGGASRLVISAYEAAIYHGRLGN